MPIVKIKLTKLRELVKACAEHHRLNMSYGCNVRKMGVGLFSSKYIHTPFSSWEETWGQMSRTYPWSELAGLYNSEFIHDSIDTDTVEISLLLAGRIGQCFKEE